MKTISRLTAESVRGMMAASLLCSPEDIFMADASHEGLTPGAWSFAAEGADWDALGVMKEELYEPLRAQGLWMESVNGCTVAIYRR